MPQYQILYWHDIPTQVRAREGRERVSKPLSPRFMESVDRAAMRARLTNHNDYPAGFHWSKAEEREGTLEEIATAVVAEIEAEYETIPWRELADRLRAERKGAEAAGVEATEAEATGVEATEAEATGVETTGVKATEAETTDAETTDADGPDTETTEA